MPAVVKQCAYALINVPDFVRYGSKPMRDLEEDASLLKAIENRLRSFEEVVAYGPNQVFIGNMAPDDLRNLAQPWHKNLLSGCDRRGPFGEIMPEEEFYGWLKIADESDIVCLETSFLDRIRDSIAAHPLLTRDDLTRLGAGISDEQNRRNIEEFALPLVHRGKVVGSLKRAHDKDDALKAEVLMENLVAKASGGLALRHLMEKADIKAGEIDFILECSETAIGDRYNRGGGSLSKAIGEMCGCSNATGYDVRAFCAAPIHAIISAAALVEAGLYQNVAVVGGGCLAKIGMKYAAHLKHDLPILEDILGSVAFLISKDDGVSPQIRLDSVGKHEIGAGSSQQAILTALILKPLKRLGMKITDVDKYATELHNPEVTLPAGSGDTPYTNYRLIGSLAALNREIEKTEIERFITEKGMPGFAPTQGHVPAAVPFLGHASSAMRKGRMTRAMFVAKGSLFLGRMSQLSDGMSFLLEANTKTL